MRDPDLARLRFRTTTAWVEGARSLTGIRSFDRADAEDTSRDAAFHLIVDEPPVLLGTNAGPSPLELVLTALASCLSIGFALNAASQGIRLDRLELAVEGDVDLGGFLGASKHARPGYQDIRVSCRLKGDTPCQSLEALSAYVQETSPVLDILRNAVPVSFELVEE